MTIGKSRPHLVAGGLRNAASRNHRLVSEAGQLSRQQALSHDSIRAKLRSVERLLRSCEAQMLKLTATADSLAQGRCIPVRWPESGEVSENWGDKLNPVLVEALSGRPVVHSTGIQNPTRMKTFLVIGSGLRRMKADDIVWGMGFIDTTDVPRERPFRVCAVRGPLTRAKMQAEGIACPEVYGDPALLMPLFYNKKVQVKHDLGVIQHFREVGQEPLPRVTPNLNVKVISITGSVDETIDAIRSCKQIVSSSLHGIIAAHAYGIPATWIKFSDRPLGDDFKFRDYFASVGLEDVSPALVGGATQCQALVGQATMLKPKVSIELLLSSCPFIDEDRKAELMSRISWAYPKGLSPAYVHIARGGT